MAGQEDGGSGNFGAFSADAMLADLRDLRTRRIATSRERGVMLSLEDQEFLRQEIIETCTLLTELTK